MAIWDTSALPEAEQFEYYHQVISRAFVPLLPIPVGRPKGFSFTVQTRNLGELNRASIDSPIQSTHHGPAEVSATNGSYYFVNLQLEGRCRARQRSVDSVVEPGQFTVLDTNEPFYLDFDRDWSMLSFRIPHDALDERILGTRIPLGTPIESAGAGAVVISLMKTLWSIEDDLSDQVASELALSFSSAVAGALTESSFDPAELQAESIRTLIYRFFRQHLSDPSLSVETVSRAFALSPRTLHTLFDDEEQTFAATLREIRMHYAADLLINSNMAVTGVGEAVGYPDPSSFGRAFRRFHGAAPRIFRMQHELQNLPAQKA